MNAMSRTDTVTARVKAGAAILAAAEVVDTQPVAARLAAFVEANRTLVDAERKIDEAEGKLAAGRLQLAQRGADHDDAVELLARRLVNDGQPRTNPFSAFGSVAPGDIRRMGPPEAVRATRALIAAMQRGNHLSPPTAKAVQQLEHATGQVEVMLAPVEQLSADLRAARQACKVVARTWAKKLAALRREARTASDEGAPDLYGALFTTGMPAKKAKSSRPAAVAPEVPAPEPSTPAS
jgi:hypothetical protein